MASAPDLRALVMPATDDSLCGCGCGCVCVCVCAGGWVGVWVTRRGLPTCQLKVRACLHGILFVLAVEVHRTDPAA